MKAISINKKTYNLKFSLRLINKEINKIENVIIFLKIKIKYIFVEILAV